MFILIKSKLIYLKKYILILSVLIIAIFIILFINTKHSKKSIVSQFVYIIDKDIDDLGRYIISVKKVYNEEKERLINIYVEDENVWNLIVADKEYYKVYDATINENIKLQQIKIVE